MKYLLLLITFLSIVCAMLTTSCDKSVAQAAKEEPPKVETPEPPKEEPENEPADDILTAIYKFITGSAKKDMEEMRFAQVLILINQECTIEGDINKECRNAVSKCFGDRWRPTPLILKCFDEWVGEAVKTTKEIMENILNEFARGQMSGLIENASSVDSFFRFQVEKIIKETQREALEHASMLIKAHIEQSQFKLNCLAIIRTEIDKLKQ